eukprot:gene5889-6331_t
MKVNEGPGYYYCFACGESGNAVKFVSKILNSSYEEAVHTCLRMIENEEELDRVFPVSSYPQSDLTVMKSKRKPVKSSSCQDLQKPLNEVMRYPSTNFSAFSNESILSTLHLANSFFMTRLFEDPDATEVRNYLKSRGISVSTAKTFQLGYAPRGSRMIHKMQPLHDYDEIRSSGSSSTWSLWEDIKYHSLTSWISNRALLNGSTPQESLELLVAAGVALNSSIYKEKSRSSYLNRSGSNPIYDRFRHRLMIPIRSIDGEIIGFGGRELPEKSTNYLASIKKIKSPGKYINTPTSKVFRKKETLFGADIASKYSRESSCVILVEGYFDVIALYEIGMRNVVASMGTSLSLQQMLLASQLSSTGTVILLFDQDAAGVKALQRVEEILEKQESKRKRDVPDIESLEWRVKAGSMKDAIKFLMQRYSSNDEMIQKFEKIKDCADLSLAVSKDEAVDAMIYLAEQARPIKETV